jgi:hypothetical protein
MLTHVIRLNTEINGMKFEFVIENNATTHDCKKALFQFVGEIDKLEFDQKQSEVVTTEPVEEGA